jgi:Protein of unknown function (DUF3110)
MLSITSTSRMVILMLLMIALFLQNVNSWSTILQYPTSKLLTTIHQHNRHSTTTYSFTCSHIQREHSENRRHLFYQCPIVARPLVSNRIQLYLHQSSNNYEEFSGNELDDFDSTSSSSSLFDMTNLQQRIEQQRNQYKDLFANDYEKHIDITKNLVVYVIVYCSYKEEKQQQKQMDQNFEIVGMHSIQYPTYSTTSSSGSSATTAGKHSKNYVLAFESYKECLTFAQLLENDCTNNNFQKPIVSECYYNELQIDCQQQQQQQQQQQKNNHNNNVLCKFVPNGFNLRPPSDVVPELTYTPRNTSDNDDNNTNDFDDKIEQANDEYEVDFQDDSSWQ